MVEDGSPSANTKKRTTSSSSSSSNKKSKRSRRSRSPASTTELYNAETGRIDTTIVNDRTAALLTAQSERFDTLDENLSREELQTRYEELRDLRITASEKILKEAVAAHQKESEAMQGLMATYKRRAAELQTQIEAVEQSKEVAIQEEVNVQVAEAAATAEQKFNTIVTSMKTEFKRERATLVAAAEAGTGHGSGGSGSSSSSTAVDVEQGYFKSVARSYEELTGLRIVMKDWEEGSVGGLQCTAINKETKKVVQFELELDSDVEEGEENEWDYTPGAHAELLPDYLREEISFPASAAAKFCTRLVDALDKK